MTRCFIAVELCDAVKAAIQAEQAVFRSGIIDGNWEKETNMHVTMKFMGDLDEQQLNLLQSKLSSLDFAEFTLTAGPIGFFKGPRNLPIRTLWAKITGAEHLQGEIDKILLPQFPPDKRHAEAMKKGEYSHHATVCRVKKIFDLSACKRQIKNSTFPITTQLVDSFVLVKSTLSKTGSIYSIIERYPAGK